NSPTLATDPTGHGPDCDLWCLPGNPGGGPVPSPGPPQPPGQPSGGGLPHGTGPNLTKHLGPVPRLTPPTLQRQPSWTTRAWRWLQDFEYAHRDIADHPEEFQLKAIEYTLGAELVVVTMGAAIGVAAPIVAAAAEGEWFVAMAAAGEAAAVIGSDGLVAAG